MGIDGALIVDKPSGPTSHDVVAVARRALKIRQIGHTGTLDPLATGVLVLLVGRATRLSQFIVHDRKEYVAEIRLGVATATYDAEALHDNSQLPTPNSQIDQSGQPRTNRIGNWELGIGSLDEVLDDFRGTFLQSPPPFSAKKVDGRRAYEQARRARPVEMQPVRVTVHELERLQSPDPRLIRLRMVVSAGFYVRSLAHVLGQRLGCGAHLETLRRTRSGPFSIDDSITLDTLVSGAPTLVPMNGLLQHIPAVTLSDEGLRRASRGNVISPGHITNSAVEKTEDGRIRLLSPDGELVAIGVRDARAFLHPQVVLV
ncbi:MAG TPA: tRNA pseudouridine(55) synthase TruB [Vicinamibacterales bacterium]|nr:tRNA pseudouridine(55) synthase TruB [Vicinamibacterales bacterium]